MTNTMTSYSSEEENSSEQQANKVEALSKLVGGIQQRKVSDSEDIAALHKENGDVDPQVLIYIWARVLADNDQSYSEENIQHINNHFDKIFTKEQKQHILIVGKFSNKRRQLTGEETVDLFERVLKEEEKRLTPEEKDYILEYLEGVEDEEEIEISEEENQIETDKIFTKFAGEGEENSEESKTILFRKLLSEETNRLSFEEEQEIISFFVINDISQS